MRFAIVFSTCYFISLVAPGASAIENNTKNASDTLQVVYPKTMRSGENEILYPIVLLRAALQSSGESFTLNASSISMAQSRSLKQIIHNDEINVAWTMTSQQREQELLPVRVPIFKGLYGWRLLVTTQNTLSSLSSIESLRDLKPVHFIQGHDWPDTKILLDSGLTVSTSIEYSSLFNMLIKGRGDVFPRSLLEVETELNTFKDDTGANLTLVPHLMLQYPAAIYFFFNKDTPKIAQAVEKGLEIMRSNGEFDRLFNAYHRSAIEHADIKNKTIIKLKNNQLPALTPLGDAALWFSEKDI
jgi:hypothetical protein